MNWSYEGPQVNFRLESAAQPGDAWAILDDFYPNLLTGFRIAEYNAYLERFPMWAEILKPRVQVQGETMKGLIEAIALERRVNRRKAEAVRFAFILLLAGLAITAADAAIVTADSVL